MWEQANRGANNWALQLVNPPQNEPLTLDEVKMHLKIDYDDEDPYLENLIVSARLVAEERTARSFITQTWDMFLDDFPRGDTITLKKPVLQEVEDVFYTDSYGSEHTMDPTLYVVDNASIPGRLFLGFSKIWPVVILQPAQAIRIRYTAGYGDDPSDVPQAIKNAMLFLIGHWYQNRRIVEVKNRYAVEIPKTFDILIGPYKVYRFM